MKIKLIKIGTPILLIIVFLILTIGFFSNLGSKKLINLDVTILNEYARTGEPLEIQIKIQNLGKNNDLNAKIKTMILNTNITKTKDISFKTSTIQTIQLPIPKKTKQGTYILETAIVFKDNKEIKNTISFHINPLKNKTFATITPDNSSIPKTESKIKTPTNNAQKNNTITTTASLKTIPDNTLYSNAIRDNNSNACTQITNKELKNVCLIKIAKKTNNKELCDSLNQNYYQEACLVQIATNGDLTACNDLKNISFIRMCKDIKINYQNN